MRECAFAANFQMTKILLLGLGRWGANHLRNLNNLPVELYVAEVGDKQLEPARKLGMPAERLTTNYKDFINKMDGVVVVTPAQSHFPLCKEFLEAGKDVFVEKPLTLANDESKQLAEIGRETQSAFCRSDTFCGLIRRRSGCATPCRTASSAR